MKILRATDRNPTAERNELQSKEQTGDRMETESRGGFVKVGGSIGYELSNMSQDDLLEAALSGTWTAVPSVSTLSSTATDYVRATGSWVTDGYRPGDLVQGSGFTAPGNNALVRVTAVTATNLTVDATLAVESSGAGKTITYPGKRLDVGQVLRTFTVERQFLDLVLYQVFKGVAIGTMSLDIKPEQIIGGSFGLVGMDPLTPMSGTSLGTPSVVSTHSPMDAFHGKCYEGGTNVAVCSGITINLDNGRSVQGVVGSQISPEVFEGTAKVTGNFMAFFKSAAFFNKFINETETSIWVKLTDPNGTDFMNVVLPRVKYTGDPLTTGEEGPITEDLPFRALKHPTYQTPIWLQRSNT
jgi:hypothetical protein